MILIKFKLEELDQVAYKYSWKLSGTGSIDFFLNIEAYNRSKINLLKEYCGSVKVWVWA